MATEDVVILGGARTPMAEYVGAFKDVSALELGAHAARAALERSGVQPAWVDHVVMGNALQTSGDAIYGARHVGAEGGRARRGARAHREPAVRLRHPVRGLGRADDPPGRVAPGARGRDGEHDARPRT